MDESNESDQNKTYHDAESIIPDEDDEIDENELKKSMYVTHILDDNDPITNNLLISCSNDTEIKLWDINEDESIRSLIAHEGAVNMIKFLPNNRLISSSEDLSVNIWDLKSGECLNKLTLSRPINFITIISDDEFAMAINKYILVFNLESDEQRRIIAHEDTITCLHTLSNRFLVSGSNDNTIKIWDIENSECVKIYQDSSRINDILSISKDSQIEN